MSAEVCRFEDFELDLGAHRLCHKGRAVHLEPIPFRLLCLLVERRGQLVTREEIIERIWGKGVFVDSENSINTAVRKIRRALNDDRETRDLSSPCLPGVIGLRHSFVRRAARPPSRVCFKVRLSDATWRWPSCAPD